MKTIEVKDTLNGHTITRTVTIASLICDCGCVLPLPFFPGNYTVTCIACDRRHGVKIDSDESEREERRVQRARELGFKI